MIAPFESLMVALSCMVEPAARLAAGAEIVTVATGADVGGGTVTVTVDEPVLPAAEALMVAEPAVRAVTSPSGATLAIADALLDQVTFWPASRLPFVSLTDAESDTVVPGAMLALPGVTVTEPTCAAVGGVLLTVIETEPLFPPTVAAIMADPAAIPVTRPLEFTLAMFGAELDHVMVWPLMTSPLVSRTCAASWSLSSTIRTAEAGSTNTIAT